MPLAWPAGSCEAEALTESRATQLPLFDELTAVLLEEELRLARLLEVAHEEQHALVHGDIAAIEVASEEMLVIAAEMDTLEARRELLVSRLDAGTTLRDIASVADDLGVSTLRDTRSRLVSRLSALREIQEANAGLILEGLRMRARWYQLLAGMSSPTYGAAGQQEMQTGRGVVSRSA